MKNFKNLTIHHNSQDSASFFVQIAQRISSSGNNREQRGKKAARVFFSYP